MTPLPKPANCNATFQPSTAQQKELRQGFDSWYEQEISFFHDQPFYPAYRDVFQAGATIADLQYIDFLSRALTAWDRIRKEVSDQSAEKG